MPWGEEKNKISTVKQSLCLTIKEIYVEYVQQNMVGHLTFQIIFFVYLLLFKHIVWWMIRDYENPFL